MKKSILISFLIFLLFAFSVFADFSGYVRNTEGCAVAFANITANPYIMTSMGDGSYFVSFVSSGSATASKVGYSPQTKTVAASLAFSLTKNGASYPVCFKGYVRANDTLENLSGVSVTAVSQDGTTFFATTGDDSLFNLQCYVLTKGSVQYTGCDWPHGFFLPQVTGVSGWGCDEIVSWSGSGFAPLYRLRFKNGCYSFVKYNNHNFFQNSPLNGTYNVSFYKPGYSAKSVIYTIDECNKWINVTLDKLPPPPGKGNLTVCVTDCDLREIMTNLRVTVNYQQKPTNVSGCASWVNVSQGNYSVDGRADGFYPHYAPVSVYANVTTNVSLCMKPYCNMRLFNGSKTLRFACENPLSNLTSSLRFFDGNFTQGILLVNLTDTANASPVRIMTSDGVKALRKLI